MSRRFVIVLVLLVCACGSRAPRGLWADPSLDSSALREGVVIGGVVDLTAERDLFEMGKDADLLAGAFAEQRAELAVTPWAEARGTIETDSMDAVLDAYRLTGRLSGRQMQVLEPLSGKGRYLALARIDLDQTRWDYTRRVRESGDRTVVDVDPESRREMALLFDLYDLRTMTLAFTVPLRRTGIEHGSVFTVEGIDGVPTEDEIRDAIADLDSSSNRPDPADRGPLLAGMFRDAVKFLP